MSGTRIPWVLVAAILGSAMGFIDGTAVNVALPVVQRELHATTAETQWVIEGYSLFLSALILVGGSLGDIYGRRLIFGCGIALFALASAACALSNSPAMLIGARCIQGIGGALLTPGSLSMLSAAYSGEARGRAIGLWSGFSALTAALGPVIGGWLTQAFSWRYVFVINLPLAVIVLLIAALHVTESRDESSSRRIDVTGSALATIGLGLLVYGLIAMNGRQSRPTRSPRSSLELQPWRSLSSSNVARTIRCCVPTSLRCASLASPMPTRSFSTPRSVEACTSCRSS